MDDQGSILDRIISQQRTSELTSFRPFELKKQLFSRLKNREEEVLTKRFGLSGKTRMTLEEIGHEFHVTRERVRQIEIFAIKKLFQEFTSNAQFSSSVRVVQYLLEQSGGVREEQDLLSDVRILFTEEKGDNADAKEAMLAAENFFLFCLNHLWVGEVLKIDEDEDFHRSWRLPGVSLDALKLFLSEARTVIERANASIPENTFVSTLRESEFWKNFETKYPSQTPKNDEGILQALRASKRIASNVYGEWGMADWPLIHPKRMTDKIFLVLKHHGKPLHFREITEKINETKFDFKKAYPPTIHNELILDKRYVLIGRGIYALTEWGYSPGTVSEVIKALLSKTAEPMKREDIVREVLKQRMVHEATVNLALTNRKFFSRAEGGYKLAEKEG